MGRRIVLACGLCLILAGVSLGENPKSGTAFPAPATIQYAIPEQAHVTVEVFNVLGRRVRLLVNKTQAPGVYYIEWNGTDQGGREVASGIYFYRVKAGDHSEKKKMVLLR